MSSYKSMKTKKTIKQINDVTAKLFPDSSSKGIPTLKLEDEFSSFNDVSSIGDSQDNFSEDEKYSRKRSASDCTDDDSSGIDANFDQSKKFAAWSDEDDVNIRVADVLPQKKHEENKSVLTESYTSYLCRNFTASHGTTPSWASLDNVKKNVVDEDEDAIEMGSSLIVNSTGSLPPNFLQYRFMADVNASDLDVLSGKHVGGISSNLRAVFANNKPLALVTRTQVKTGGIASVFHVTSEKCISMERLFFKNFRISSSLFLPGDSKFILGSNCNKDLFVYDMEGAKEMRIPWVERNKAKANEGMAVLDENQIVIHEKTELTLFDIRTFRPCGTLRPPTPPGPFCVSQHGDTVYTHGKSDGTVHIWDVNMRRPRASFLDEGCINSTSMAVSPNGVYLACGGDSGIVNVYSCSEVESKSYPAPVKALKQLVTDVSCLQFNNTSELLFMSSLGLQEAIRLVHLPSLRAFSNFPPVSSNMKKVLSASFSPNSGYLAISTIEGKVKCIRLEHFSKY